MYLANILPKLRALNGRRIFIKLLGAWLILTTSAVTLVTWGNPKMRAVLGMGWGLILLWIFFPHHPELHFPPLGH